MAENQHTPGPWPWAYTGDGKRIVIGEGLVEGPNGYEVAEVYSDDCPRELAEANAKLISAAPELLHEITLLRDRFRNAVRAAGNDEEVALWSTPGADAAIAKAKGA